MLKIKSLFLKISHLLIFTILSCVSNATEQEDRGTRYSQYLFGLHDTFDFPLADYGSNPTKVTPQPIFQPHAIVPDSSGRQQEIKKLKPLFSGDENPETVRITTRVSPNYYTFRERFKYVISGEKPFAGKLTGTITPDGIITNGHGFIEKVPSITNKVRKLFGSENYDYRPLALEKIEQGLTLNHFVTVNPAIYYDPSLLPPSLEQSWQSIHAVYSDTAIDTINISNFYLQDTQKIGRWNYGKLNHDHDLALLTFKEEYEPKHVCPISTELPSINSLVRVRMYQYPLGHPLQKVSEGDADFTLSRHYCLTLHGSSGSALRDPITGHIIGIHAGGYPDKHNYFIPITKATLNDIEYKL